jgi:hypothetical protein
MGCMISQISGISLRPSLGDPSRWLPFHVAEAVNGRDFVSPQKMAGDRDESGNLMYFEMCINTKNTHLDIEILGHKRYEVITFTTNHWNTNIQRFQRRSEIPSGKLTVCY